MRTSLLHSSFALGTFLVTGLMWHPPAFADALPEPAREGVAHYNEENFSKAGEKFQEAEAEAPDNPTVRYNAGNTNYRLGRFEAAIEDYNKVLSGNAPPELKQKTHYNEGNAWYRLGALDRAMESYKKALELNPRDEDSKFNYEYAKQQWEQAIASGQIMPRNLDTLKPKPSATGKAPPPEESESAQNEAANHPDTSEQNEQPEPGDTKTADQDQNPPENDTAKNESEELAKQKPPAASSPEKRNMDRLLKEAAPMSEEEAERLLGSLNEDLKKFKRRQMQGEMQDLFKEQRKDW